MAEEKQEQPVLNIPLEQISFVHNLRRRGRLKSEGEFDVDTISLETQGTYYGLSIDLLTSVVLYNNQPVIVTIEKKQAEAEQYIRHLFNKRISAAIKDSMSYGK